MADYHTAKQMDSLIDEWQRRQDRRVDFLRCYRLMTGNMQLAIKQDEFHDGPWVQQLLDRFADYYFTALTDYEQDRPDTPPAWAAAHRAALRQETLVIQNLLLGINAHINYDLVLSLHDVLSPNWRALSATARRRRYEDHRQVNVIIGRTVDAVQDDIIEPKEPLLKIVDALFGPIDEWAASIMIRHWREEVWQHALQMLAAHDDAERETLRQQVERLALERARAILRPTGLGSLDALF